MNYHPKNDFRASSCMQKTGLTELQLDALIAVAAFERSYGRGVSREGLVGFFGRMINVTSRLKTLGYLAGSGIGHTDDYPSKMLPEALTVTAIGWEFLGWEREVTVERRMA